jgi:hypothetical protein
VNIILATVNQADYPSPATLKQAFKAGIDVFVYTDTSSIEREVVIKWIKTHSKYVKGILLTCDIATAYLRVKVDTVNRVIEILS